MPTINISGQSSSVSSAVVKRKSWGQRIKWGVGVWGQNKSLMAREVSSGIIANANVSNAVANLVVDLTGQSNSVFDAKGKPSLIVRAGATEIAASSSVFSPNVILHADELTEIIAAVSSTSTPRLNRTVAYSSLPVYNYQFVDGIHPVINTEDLPADVLNINNPYAITIVVSQGKMQINGIGTFDLTQYTVQSLADLINTFADFQSYVLEYGSLSALALLDGMYITPCNIAVSTNPILIYAKTVDQQFQALQQNANDALFQTDAKTASGTWLDTLGSFYGVQKQAPEADSLYSSRMYDCSLGERVNNIAIQRLFADMGYTATVEDTTPGPAFTVTVQMPMSVPTTPVMDSAYFVPLVSKLKAAGVNATIVLQYTLNDVGAGIDSISEIVITPGSGQLWGNGRKWGQGRWYPPTQYNPPHQYRSVSEMSKATDNLVSIISSGPHKWGMSRKWGQGTH